MVICISSSQAQTNAPAKSLPSGEPLEYATTPEGLPAEELQIRDLDYSPDGKLLAVGYGRWTTVGVVRVYEVATKKLLQSFNLSKGASAVDFSRNGKWLAASSWDRKVYVWDTENYSQLAEILGGSKAVRAAFSPDCKWLGVAGEGTELKLFDTATWQEARTFKGDVFRFQHLAFSPDSKLIVAAGGSFENMRFGRALIFEVESGKQRSVLNAGNQPLGCAAWSPDGQTIAAGAFDNVIRLFDAVTGKERLAMSDPLGGGSSERVSFSPDGQTLAASGSDSVVRIWNVSDGRMVGRIQQPAYVLAVAYSPNGSQVAAGGDDKTVHILDAKKQQELFTLHPLAETADDPSPILALAASRDGRFLATAHEDLSVRLRDAGTGKVLRTLEGHSDVIAALAFSPDSQWLATGSYDRLIKLWPLSVGESLRDSQRVSEKPAYTEPKTLKGHTNWVFALEFSRDGTRLASGGYDKTVRIWDPAAGQQVASLTGHTATVRSVAFSPDGKRLVSGSADRTARIWDLADPSKFIELKGREGIKGHEGAIRAVAFSPDGEIVATGSEDNSILLWEARTGLRNKILTGHTNMVWCLAFSPGGWTLASGSFDNTVRIWDFTKDGKSQELKGHTDAVTALVYTPDSRAVITASYDKTLKRWGSKDPPAPPLADLQVADDGGARFAFVTPDQQTLVTGNNNRHVKFWDLATGRLLKDATQERGMAGGEMSRDGKFIVASGYGRQVYLWDVAQQRVIKGIDTGHTDHVAVAISPDNTKIATGGNDGAIVIVEVESGSKLHEFASDGLAVGGLEFSPDGTLLASCTGYYKEWQKPGSVKLWEVATGRELVSLPGTTAKMRRVRFTADGKTLLACGAQHEVLVYDVFARWIKYTIPTDDEITDIAILPDQKTIACGQFKGTVSLYDFVEKRKIGEVDGHRGAKEKYVFAVAASPDGSVILSAGADSHVKLWTMGSTTPSAATLQSLAEVRDDELETFGVAWSPDGALLATGSKDKTVKLRDAKTLEVQQTLTGHQGLVFRLAYHPTGKWLASASADGTVCVWDMADGKRLHMLKGYGPKVAQVRSLAFSPDGQTLAAGNWEGEIRVWRHVDGFTWNEKQIRLTRLPDQSLPVTGLAFSPDGKLLASSTGSWQEWQRPGDVRLWNAQTGEEVAQFEGSTAELKGLFFDRSGERLIAFGLNKQLFVWDVAKRSKLSTFTPDMGLTAATLLSDQRLLAIGDIKGNVSIRELESGHVIGAIPGSGKQTANIALSPDGSALASVGLDGMLRVFKAAQDVPQSKPTRTLAETIRAWGVKTVANVTTATGSTWEATLARELAPHSQQVWFAVYSPDGSTLATGGSDRSVKLWDAASFELKGELKGHANFLTHAAWSPDGKRLASGAWDKTVAIWDVDQQKRIGLLEGHELGIRKVAWSADGKLIASAGEDGKVCIWDADTFQKKHAFELGLPAYSVAFSPDSQTLAVGTGDYKTKAEGQITLWDPAKGQKLRELSGSNGYVFHLAWLAADRLLAANAGEGVVVWNPESGKIETSYRTVKDVRWLEASRDGKRVVAAHYDGKSWISVWDRDTPTPLVTFNGHNDFGFTAAFTPDGQRIVSGAGDGRLKVWDLKPAAQSAATGAEKKTEKTEK